MYARHNYSRRGFLCGRNSMIHIVSPALQNKMSSHMLLWCSHSFLRLYFVHSHNPSALGPENQQSKKLQENQSRKQEAPRWANTLIAFSSLGVMSRAWWGEEGLNAVLKHLISTSCNNSLRQLAWKVVTGMPSQLWKLACFTTNPVSGAQTVAEYHSHKHLLRGTGGLKGFINAAEAEVGNCWMFILEQPSGMYQPSFSGVAKEDGKGRGKALISRKDILSWRTLSLRVDHYLTGKNT